jgi:hypothetical protein
VCERKRRVRELGGSVKAMKGGGGRIAQNIFDTFFLLISQKGQRERGVIKPKERL